MKKIIIAIFLLIVIFLLANIIFYYIFSGEYFAKHKNESYFFNYYVFIKKIVSKFKDYEFLNLKKKNKQNQSTLLNKKDNIKKEILFKKTNNKMLEVYYAGKYFESQLKLFLENAIEDYLKSNKQKNNSLKRYKSIGYVPEIVYFEKKKGIYFTYFVLNNQIFLYLKKLNGKEVYYKFNDNIIKNFNNDGFIILSDKIKENKKIYYIFYFYPLNLFDKKLLFGKYFYRLSELEFYLIILNILLIGFFIFIILKIKNKRLKMNLKEEGKIFKNKFEDDKIKNLKVNRSSNHQEEEVKKEEKIDYDFKEKKLEEDILNL